MRFVKSISLFILYPFTMLLVGFVLGVWAYGFFYPGYTKESEHGNNNAAEEMNVSDKVDLISQDEPGTDYGDESIEVVSVKETLTADTKYVIEENDMLKDSVVETVWTIPHKYIGMNREQFVEAITAYGENPPLAEVERGFVGLQVLSFSRDRVVVQMDYKYVQPGSGYYVAVFDNEVIVYLEDKETVYINTGIKLENLPAEVQSEVIQMMWMTDEESLYGFLEAYSS